MVYRGEYDPYGNLVYEWGSAGLNTRKFTGYERDATGLDYANARMYGPGRGRFMQPDPLGLGGANKANPQSLNRYSYVQNDPVNFVDKSGKLLGAPDGPSAGGSECRSTFVAVDWTSDTVGNGFISYGFTYRFCIYSSSGNDFEGYEQDVQPSCSEFVQSLVDIIKVNYGTDEKYPTKGGISGKSLVMNHIGWSMINRAKDNRDGQGKWYRKGPTMPIGFKKELIDNGQMGDVYHYIEFVAGTYFLGVMGSIMRQLFIYQDQQQANQGRLESITVLRDDYAGEAVGDAMVATFDHANFYWLDKKLHEILCNE